MDYLLSLQSRSANLQHPSLWFTQHISCSTFFLYYSLWWRLVERRWDIVRLSLGALKASEGAFEFGGYIRVTYGYHSRDTWGSLRGM